MRLHQRKSLTILHLLIKLIKLIKIRKITWKIAIQCSSLNMLQIADFKSQIAINSIWIENYRKENNSCNHIYIYIYCSSKYHLIYADIYLKYLCINSLYIYKKSTVQNWMHGDFNLFYNTSFNQIRLLWNIW